MRTPQEILDRIFDVERAGNDIFGAERTDLITALPFEDAKHYLKPETTPAEWAETVTDTDEKIHAAAVEYLDFAYGKARDHRGLSAGRSLAHFRAWLWLLGLLPDDWDDLPYAMYGAPALFVATELLGQPLPTDEPLVRMSQGKRCGDDEWCEC